MNADLVALAIQTDR